MSISRAIGGILVVLLILLTAASAQEGTDDARTADQTQPFAGVTTGGGVTTANVTLAIPSAYDDVRAMSVSSNNASDVPAPTAYNATTQVVTVGGLAASDTRTLTVAYKIAAMNGTGAGAFALVTPTLLLVAAVAFAGMLILKAFTD